MDMENVQLFICMYPMSPLQMTIKLDYKLLKKSPQKY